MSKLKKLLAQALKTKSSEEKFWEWFIHFRDRIINIPNDSSFIPRVGENLQTVNSALTFEIGQTDPEHLDFIISCDGVKAGIPFVENLANAAPNIEGIRIIKFRQPKNEILSVKIDDKVLSANDIFFEYRLDEKLHLHLLVPNYKEGDSTVLQMVFIILDNLVGEYFVMTKIGEIFIENLNENVDIKDFQKLSDLGNIIKSKLN